MKTSEIYKMLAKWGSFRQVAIDEASKFDLKQWAVDLSNALIHVVNEYDTFQLDIASALEWKAEGRPFVKYIEELVTRVNKYKQLVKAAYVEGYTDGNADGYHDVLDSETAWFTSDVRKDIDYEQVTDAQTSDTTRL